METPQFLQNEKASSYSAQFRGNSNSIIYKLLQIATKIYYKLRQLNYYELRQFYYKRRQLLQIATSLLQITTAITNCDNYYKLRQNRIYLC